MFVSARESNKERTKKHMRETANGAQSDLSSMAHAVGEQVREMVESATAGMSHARDSISDATGNVAAHIRRNPLPASAIALGIGVLLGAFLRRR
jgi:ElaB/YqjD/DUF883 family membrane-anchored ribosome-binding protein